MIGAAFERLLFTDEKELPERGVFYIYRKSIYMGIIYKATLQVGTNPGHRCYVGKTTRLLAKRRADHEGNAEKGANSYFYAALRKYGKDAFTWEILDHADTNDELSLLETIEKRMETQRRNRS
jgi:hypothetical protein